MAEHQNNTPNPQDLLREVWGTFSQVPRFSVLILRTLSSPILVYFIIAGNSILVACMALFYKYESTANPNVNSYLDALWWGVATVTTVGYGDIVPLTYEGRLVSMVAMVIGVIFFVGFTALFVSILFTRATRDIAETRLLTYREMEGILLAMERLEKKIDQLEKKITS